MTTQSTFSEEIVALDSGIKERFRSLLATYDGNAEEIDLEAFSAIVRLAHLFIPTGELCSEFGLTRGMVSRYRMGVTRPAPYLRNQIICWIRERLNEPTLM